MKEIILTKGYKAMVDDEDYEWLNILTWTACESYSTVYAYRAFGVDGKKNVNTKMERYVIDCPKGMEIDHIDHNGLNNQRSNLRACTHQQNVINRRVQRNNKSGFPGVRFRSDRGKFSSTIKYKGKPIALGCYLTALEAHVAYKNASKELFGEYVCTNF